MGNRIRLAGFYFIFNFLRGGGGGRVTWSFGGMSEVVYGIVSSAVKVFCFEYQHPYSDAKNENLQKQLDEKWERERERKRWENISVGYTSRGYRCPLEKRRHGKMGGWEWDSRERKALASVRGWGRLCYDMEIPACWSCSPVGLWVAVRPWSLATSYLALVAARIQGMNLSLTPLPATNQIPWERWGVTQRMLLSPCPLPFCLPPSCSSHTSAPNIFLLCQREIKHHPLLSLLPELANLKSLACLFVCHVNY